LLRLFLIRHGRSEWNAAHRIQGCADSPLDEVGHVQARQLAARLHEAPPVTVYTSPLLRARETADVIGQVFDIPVVPEGRLREYDVGALSGLTWVQVEAQYPEVARQWQEDIENVSLPEAEDRAIFRERVVAGFDDIVARHSEGPVAVVSHGGTLGIYLNHLIGLPRRFSPFRFSNVSLSIVDVNPRRPRVILLNDTCHLGSECDLW